MARLIYGQFADLNTLHNSLRSLSLSEEELAEILNLVDEVFHTRLLHAILEELENEEKIRLLELVEIGSPIEVVDYVKAKVVNIEDKIRLVVEEVHIQVLEDISTIE